MFKYLFLLFLISENSYADWQLLGRNEAETAYVDAVNITNGSTRKMWALFDLKAPRALGDLSYLSMKIRREYSCEDKKTRIIYRSAYTLNRGEGELIYSSNTREKWANIRLDSVEEVLFQVACGKSGAGSAGQ